MVNLSEYQNYGPGSVMRNWVTWVGFNPVMAEEDAQNFTIDNLINKSVNLSKHHHHSTLCTTDVTTATVTIATSLIVTAATPSTAAAALPQPPLQSLRRRSRFRSLHLHTLHLRCRRDTIWHGGTTPPSHDEKLTGLIKLADEVYLGAKIDYCLYSVMDLLR
ncbi:unnamed protein product [Eruca vesicaria subsp. sativa]|uniref:Pectinesterase catalytic domain-containing protein n=1 Tax=Eruca vesicaria subsp. sativa TaxID=29727 RepID=A0ABC8KD76_ERUVS|nr:unnamed protein product [Eruca vesicaria subsp. sativa]